MARLSNPRSAQGRKVKRVIKVSNGTQTSLYNLRKGKSVVGLSFQNCNTPKDTVRDIERIITEICPFHYAVASMQSTVSNLATLICMTETNECVGNQC